MVDAGEFGQTTRIDFNLIYRGGVTRPYNIYGGYNFAIMSFTELITTFANNLLPILLIAAAGYILGKTLTIDTRTIGRMVFYVFSPLLVFNLMVTSQLNLGQAITTVGYTTTIIILMGGIAFLLGKVFRLERSHSEMRRWRSPPFFTSPPPSFSTPRALSSPRSGIWI